jgi:hypothetical protein
VRRRHGLILLEDFRPGIAERLGIGPDACLKRAGAGKRTSFASFQRFWAVAARSRSVREYLGTLNEVAWGAASGGEAPLFPVGSWDTPAGMSFGQPSFPQSLLVSRQIFTTSIRAKNVFEIRNTQRGN